MYDELLRAMEQYFDEVKVLKRGARGTVTLVRHRQTGQRYVFRRFDGAADVYRRLLTVSSPYLPRVEEVAESHGRVAALEEYVQGDTLLYLLEGGLLARGPQGSPRPVCGAVGAAQHGRGTPRCQGEQRHPAGR